MHPAGPDYLFALIIAGLLSWLSVSLRNWFRKLFGRPGAGSAKTSNGNLTNSTETKLSSPNPNDFTTSTVSDSEMRLRADRRLRADMRWSATSEGGASGLLGVLLGLWGVGYILEIITRQPGPGGNSQILLVGILLTYTLLYPLMAAAIGAFIGQLSVKDNFDPKNKTVVFRYVRIAAGIIGFIMGVLPYSLIWFLRE